MQFSQQTSGEIIRRINIIDNLYAKFSENDLWLKIKEERVGLANALLEAKDAIDKAWTRFVNKQAEWETVEKAIDQYGNAWHKIAIAFR